MKLLPLTILLATLVVGGVNSQVCNLNNCQLPDCRCASNELGSQIPFQDIPQLVMITFDDAVTAQIFDLIMPIIDGRVNPDGCPAQITYFHSHEYTDYSKVHELWAKGHELALHSISHTPSVQYWEQISLENMTAEFGDQRKIVSHFGQIHIDDVQGMRVPLLQLSGDTSFVALRNINLTYDSTWPTQLWQNGLWPYTLDYNFFPSVQDCPLERCPTSSIPGAWIIPMLMWDDIEGVKCSFLDACRTIPSSDDVDAMVEWMKSNFHRVYDSTRAPFPIYMHAAWLLQHENHPIAYHQFLDYIQSFSNTYFVSSQRVIEYTRNPRPNSTEGGIFDSCQAIRPNTCVARTCPLRREDIGQDRWMTSCAPCPVVYPWINNPFGLDQN